MTGILDVDLLRFENGDRAARRAVVDGTMRSLRTGFVFTRHDLSTDLVDEAYAGLATFFHLDAELKNALTVPGSHGQTGYTGVLVETAASSEVPDWKEMLNWGAEIPAGHPLAMRYPHRYLPPVFPEDAVPGITETLTTFHERLFDLQRRFMAIIAEGLGCSSDFFDRMLLDGPTLTRAIRYPPMASAPAGGHVWAGEHGDINLITALPRASRPGLQVKTDDGWVDAIPPEGQAVINTGMMLEQVSNGVLPTGIHRVMAEDGVADERYSVVQFCHPTPWTVLSPVVSCVSEDNPQRFGAIEAGARLDEVLYEINLVEDARRV